jgi:predicted transcriptional regulator
MKPKAIIIVVSEKVKDRLESVCQKRSLSRRDLFMEAFQQFSKKNRKTKNYTPKHEEIDRVRSFNYSVRLFPETVNELDKLSEQLGIQRSVLVREIVCEYVNE